VAEQEVKLGAPPSFRLPSLDGVADGVSAEPREPQRLSATYLDTDDLRLTSWGVSLRFRNDEGWTVKLPIDEVDGLLVRGEHTFGGNVRRPAPEAIDLVQAFVRTGELRPQVRLRTVRRGVVLRSEDGDKLADVVDDEVSVLDGRRIAARFRELEVEIASEVPRSLLDAVLRQLQVAGAGEPDPTTKLIRALGSRAGRPPEVVVEGLARDASAGDVIRRALAASVARLISHDPVVRLDVDPEGVHQARVATRRLRSDLRTFRTLLDADWAGALRDELGWLADILGRVRDGDVMLLAMRDLAALLPEARAPDAARILATLEQERDAAHEELLATLRGERYVALLDRLVEAARAPALLAEAGAPAQEVVPALVRRPWRSLVRKVKAASDPPTDDELHAIRIRTKRVRYAAEAVAPVAGKTAGRFASAAADLQDVLGELNDAVVAEEWLRAWAGGSRSLRAVFAAGELAGFKRTAGLKSRGRWPKAWKRLSASKLCSWL
jgi:CHAD domain-containing protein